MPHAPQRKPARPMVALLTDFGLSDPYVGQMKAALVSLAPEATILDVSHGVPAHDVLAGAFYLDASLPWLPPGSVTVAVVDPGVGTARRIVGLKSAGRVVLAPDNGLLTLVLSRGPVEGGWSFAIPPQASVTFHGRDVFAPLAAAAAAGTPLDELGRPADPASFTVLPNLEPVFEHGRLTTTVLHTDRFGNLILNLRISDHGPMPGAASELGMEAPGAPRVVRAATYAAVPPGALGLVAGSQGHFELAMNRESAARTTGLRPGDRVTLTVAGDPEDGTDLTLDIVSER